MHTRASTASMPSQTTSLATREWSLLLVLAGAQFSHILDFMMIMPLGPRLMSVFSISPQQFSFLVSIYTLSGAFFGFLGSLVIDRFDRKTALLMLYAGFTTGTLCCALASTYEFLLLARMVAGAFGGLIGAIVFSIIGDSFAESRRATATGTVMSAFSLASVLGVPFGIYLTVNVSWQSPFVMLSLLSLVMMLAAFRILPPMRSHLAHRPPTKKQTQKSSPRGGAKQATLPSFTGNHLTAYLLIISLMFAVFSVIPFLSAYLVSNVGLREKDLTYVYLSGGAFTLVTSRFVGQLADRHGKQKLFIILASLSIIPVLVLTNLPHVSVLAAVIVTTLFTVLISGRAIPAMSLITSTVNTGNRGSFLSFTTAIQQLASGIASFVSGIIVGKATTGELTNYNVVGAVAVVSTLISIVLVRRLKVVAN